MLLEVLIEVVARGEPLRVKNGRNYVQLPRDRCYVGLFLRGMRLFPLAVLDLGCGVSHFSLLSFLGFTP